METADTGARVDINTGIRAEVLGVERGDDRSLLAHYRSLAASSPGALEDAVLAAVASGIGRAFSDTTPQAAASSIGASWVPLQRGRCAFEDAC
jgi:hypothetical protein